MPSHLYHQIVRELLTPKKKKKLTTDQILDMPFKFYGRGHRKHFHNIRDILILSLLSDNPKRFLNEALIHIWLDRFKMRKKYKRKKRRRY